MVLANNAQMITIRTKTIKLVVRDHVQKVGLLFVLQFRINATFVKQALLNLWKSPHAKNAKKMSFKTKKAKKVVKPALQDNFHLKHHLNHC